MNKSDIAILLQKIENIEKSIEPLIEFYEEVRRSKEIVIKYPIPDFVENPN